MASSNWRRWVVATERCIGRRTFGGCGVVWACVYVRVYVCGAGLRDSPPPRFISDSTRRSEGWLFCFFFLSLFPSLYPFRLEVLLNSLNLMLSLCFSVVFFFFFCIWLEWTRGIEEYFLFSVRCSIFCLCC